MVTRLQDYKITRLFWLIPFIFIIFIIPKTRASFSDISSSSSNYQAITYVQDEGIVSGYPDGSFRSSNLINRAEFTKIIINSQFDESEINDCISKNTQSDWSYVFFSDVPKNAWFAKYVCIAKTNNIIGGYPDSTFKPSNNINFAEASKIIVNTFDYEVGSDSVWYAPFAKELSDRKAIPTTIDQLDKTISRGEMAEMIYRLLEEIDNLDSSEFLNNHLSVPQTQIKSYETRSDGAMRITNCKKDSCQNAVFSPNNKEIMFTRFLNGYNAGPSRLVRINLETQKETVIISTEDNDHVAVPYGSWINDKIIWSSDYDSETDEIFIANSDGTDMKKVTSHKEEEGCYIEPVFNPTDTTKVIFEYCPQETTDKELLPHHVYLLDLTNNHITPLTNDSGFDDRLPSWSYDGEKILWQRIIAGNIDTEYEDWDIVIADIENSHIKNIQTLHHLKSQDTDNSWGFNNKYVLSSSDYGNLEHPNIFAFPIDGGKPMRITNSTIREDGAPAISPNQKWISFESHNKDDENSPSNIWIISSPKLQESEVQQSESQESEVQQSGFPIHKDITVTKFWAGETANESNGNITNMPSSWDEKWAEHFGGIDNPDERNGYNPADFTPSENPFYFALPYTDFGNSDRKRDANTTVYWANEKTWGENESMCKNRWIKIMTDNKTAYAQWEDSGPFNLDDSDYVFGTAKPNNSINNNAGLDVSPAVSDYLGLTGIDKTDWQFVDENDVPNGPWKKTITTSGTCWDSSCTEVSHGYWVPNQLTTWDWQLNLPVNESVDVEVIDIDLFDNDASVVKRLHDSGKKVICYISAGSTENWRPDKDDFPSSVIGNDYAGWPGEKWLDIRQIDKLAPIMQARMDLCKSKGFDALEPDNIQNHEENTGFPITAENQLTYNKWLANEAHKRGLSIGLKNDSDQAKELVSYFDWALTEECYEDNWCEEMKPFTDAGKAVFMTEYTERGTKTSDFCSLAKSLKFNGLLKKLDLDEWGEPCL